MLFSRWRFLESRDEGERVRGPQGRMISGFQAPPLTSFSIVAPPNNIPYNYAFSKVHTFLQLCFLKGTEILPTLF